MVGRGVFTNTGARMVGEVGSSEGAGPYSHTTPALMPRQRLIRAMLRAAEVSATVVALFALSQAVLPLVMHGSADFTRDAEPRTPIEGLAARFVWGFTLLQCAIRPRRLLRALTENPFVPAVVLIALLSVSWSVDPVATLRRAYALGMLTLFGSYLGFRYSSSELLRLLGVTFGVIAVLSLWFGLVLPDYGIAQGVTGDAWQGVFTHKNTLGQSMLVATIVFGSLAARRDGLRFVAWAATALAAALIILSRSMTALLVLGALMVAIPLAILLRRKAARTVLLLFAACWMLAVGVLIAATYREPVLSALGRDVTLTGRTPIWVAVMDRISERPLLGYGYGAFWLHQTGPGEVVRAAVGWDTPHSHNGFLDLWADLGLLGLTVFATAFALALRRAWVRWIDDPSAANLWPLAFLLATWLSDLTESPLSGNFLVWALFVFAATARPQRDDTRPGPFSTVHTG